jgi:hypothetical protein
MVDLLQAAALYDHVGDIFCATGTSEANGTSSKDVVRPLDRRARRIYERPAPWMLDQLARAAHEHPPRPPRHVGRLIVTVCLAAPSQSPIGNWHTTRWDGEHQRSRCLTVNPHSGLNGATSASRL